jgi:uncharacterized protein (TIGR02611 family)
MVVGAPYHSGVNQSPLQPPQNAPPKAHVTVRTARRIVVAVVGITVALLGVLMLVLPGPGVVTILAGLGILSMEFAFAKNWIKYIRARSTEAADRASIPKRWRWAFPVVAMIVGAAALVFPMFVSVVYGPSGVVLVAKPTLSTRWSWVAESELRRAAESGDQMAVRLLSRVEADRNSGQDSQFAPLQ